MADESSNSKDLWGPIEREAWSETTCIVGRAATEQDVKQGRAVFYVDGPSEPVQIDLPHFAVFRDESGEKFPVIAIQAESHLAGQVLIGYRPLSGGNGICTLDEVELLDGSDEYDKRS